MTYIYFCKNCDFEKEVEHSIKHNPKICCDKCAQIMRRKITGGIGEIYRGLGWPRKGTGTAPVPKMVTEKIAVGPPPKRK